MASEMLYPIMPIYLKSIGFSILLIGVLEGLVEAVAGLSKGYFGQLSDSKAKRAPFVQLGYSLSAISKPMMAFFVYPLWIFFARTTDRLGKESVQALVTPCFQQRQQRQTKERFSDFTGLWIPLEQSSVLPLP